MAAMLNTRNGMSTAWSQYSSAMNGTTRKATSNSANTNHRSWTMGNIAWSAA